MVNGKKKLIGIHTLSLLYYVYVVISFNSIYVTCILKVGESGYVILDNASFETSTDPDDQWNMGPPSPCDVQFVNDNIIINGKSSLKKSFSRDNKVSHFIKYKTLKIIEYCQIFNVYGYSINLFISYGFIFKPNFFFVCLISFKND